MVVFFRAVRQPILSLRSSRRIVRRLAGVPSANRRRDNSRSDRFVHSTPARIGSPAVNSCNKWRRFTSRVGCATVRGGRPPLFCGCVPPLHPWAPPGRGGLDGWFSGRTPRFGRCTQSRHAPAWRPRWPHIDVDLSPTATQRIVASSLQSRLYILPYRPPGWQGLRRRQDTTTQASREVILNRILIDAERAAALGIDAFLLKPVEPKTLA